MGMWGGGGASGWSTNIGGGRFGGGGASRGADGWDDEYLGKVYDAEVIRRLQPYLKPYKWQMVVAFAAMSVQATTTYLQPLVIGLTVSAGIAAAESTRIGIAFAPFETEGSDKGRQNTLLKLAADKVGGWEELKPSAKGDNAWLFIEEDHVAASIKAYLGFQSKLRDALPKDERAAFKLLDPSGGAMAGKALDAAEIKRLEKLPTKKELIATIARLIQQVPTKVAVSIKQVPTKVALGVKALADADDNKEALVGDVCKPQAAE